MLRPKSYRRLTSKSRSRKRTKRSSMDTSCLPGFPGGTEIRVSFLPRNDPPSFVLFIPVHKSLSLGLSETYFPAETAFLNSIRSHRRANRRGRRARRAKSKKRASRPRKANRCPLTALSLFDGGLFRAFASRTDIHFYYRFDPHKFAARYLAAAKSTRARAEAVTRSLSLSASIDKETDRIGNFANWNNVRDRGQPTTLYSGTLGPRNVTFQRATSATSGSRQVNIFISAQSPGARLFICNCRYITISVYTVHSDVSVCSAYIRIIYGRTYNFISS